MVGRKTEARGEQGGIGGCNAPLPPLRLPFALYRASRYIIVGRRWSVGASCMDKWVGDDVGIERDAKLELGRQKNMGFILGKAGKNDNAVQILQLLPPKPPSENKYIH